MKIEELMEARLENDVPRSVELNKSSSVLTDFLPEVLFGQHNDVVC